MVFGTTVGSFINLLSQMLLLEYDQSRWRHEAHGLTKDKWVAMEHKKCYEKSTQSLRIQSDSDLVLGSLRGCLEQETVLLNSTRGCKLFKAMTTNSRGRLLYLSLIRAWYVSLGIAHCPSKYTLRLVGCHRRWRQGNAECVYTYLENKANYLI